MKAWDSTNFASTKLKQQLQLKRKLNPKLKLKLTLQAQNQHETNFASTKLKQQQLNKLCKHNTKLIFLLGAVAPGGAARTSGHELVATCDCRGWGESL